MIEKPTNLIERKEHEKISPTAKLVAYWRSECGIPYAQEIAKIADTEKTAKDFFDKEDLSLISDFVTPYIEARYKTINRYIDEEKITNVLEMAMGLLPRGLEYVSKGKIYVGTDLPEILKESSEILLEIAERERIPVQDMHLLPVNVLKKDELNEAIKYFDNQKIGICNEGLLMYLSRDEQSIMAKNIRDVLLKSGGIWITPDIDILDKMKERLEKFPDPRFKKIREKTFNALNDKTKCNILENYFKTEEEAITFYETLGFSVELKPFYDVNELYSFNNVPDNMKEYITKWINSKKTWILRPRK